MGFASGLGFDGGQVVLFGAGSVGAVGADEASGSLSWAGGSSTGSVVWSPWFSDGASGVLFSADTRGPLFEPQPNMAASRLANKNFHTFQVYTPDGSRRPP